jgi:hypothetical protein
MPTLEQIREAKESRYPRLPWLEPGGRRLRGLFSIVRPARPAVKQPEPPPAVRPDLYAILKSRAVERAVPAEAVAEAEAEAEAEAVVVAVCRAVPEPPAFVPSPLLCLPAEDICPVCWVRRGRCLTTGSCVCHDRSLLRFSMPS